MRSAVTTVTLRSDASGEQNAAFGAVLDLAGAPTTTRAIHGLFADVDRVQQDTSITYLEEYASVAGVTAFVSAEWRGRLVRLCMDNIGAVYDFNAGNSSNSARNKLILHLYDLAAKHGFEFYAEWTPREMNVIADAISKARSIAHAHELLSALDLRRPIVITSAPAVQY